MISDKRKLELKAEKDLIEILYSARGSEGHFKTIIQIEPLTKEDIQNVIDHYL